MQAKFLIVFRPVAGPIVTCTEGFEQPVGQPPVGKKERGTLVLLFLTTVTSLAFFQRGS